MIKASYRYHQLIFKNPSGTSRGILKTKDSWFLILEDSRTGICGIGECSIIEGLNPETKEDVVNSLERICTAINGGQAINIKPLNTLPSVRFALEMAQNDFIKGGRRIFYDSPFVTSNAPIPINGLVWMGSRDFMSNQIRRKIEEGYRCIKLKIGAINFEDEMALLKSLRDQFSSDDIEIRVDANGAFDPSVALEKLKRLSDLDLHSIEQPIQQGQWELMASLCSTSPLSIALDEELIGIQDANTKQQLLDTIKPQYIILKPSLVGGFAASDEWISMANNANVGWWITSALESNIGLNAIAQWTALKESTMYQGLGTGKLYTNNIPSPLEIIEASLVYLNQRKWNLRKIIDG